MVVESALGSAAKYIFVPMLNFLNAAYSTWRSKKKEDRDYRAQIFKEQFLPAFTRLEAIHKDYLVSFHEFYEICKKFETPPQDLLAKFRRYGMEYSTWREDSRFFVNVCESLTENRMLPKEKEVIDNFATAIRNYFTATFPDGSVFAPSWFSGFLSQFEDLVRRGQSPWDVTYDGYGFGNDPKGTFMKFLQTVYQKELPARWKKLNEAKAELQAALVRA